jgi:hypothetical protein
MNAITDTTPEHVATGTYKGRSYTLYNDPVTLSSFTVFEGEETAVKQAAVWKRFGVLPDSQKKEGA